MAPIQHVIKAKIAVFRGPGQLFGFLERVVNPLPGVGECLVELSLATVCGSDLHTVDGRRNGPVPACLGHEGVGRVLAVGAGRYSVDAKLLGKA